MKWHRTAAGQYDFEYFMQVKKPSVTSLIQKLFESWKDLKEAGDAEIWRVSNWPAATDLGGFIREGYDLDESFHVRGPRSKVGKVRKRWCETVKADAEEFTEFCRALGLRLGFGSTRDLEENIDGRVFGHGLKSGQGPRRTVLGAIRELIKSDGPMKKIPHESLREHLRERPVGTGG